MPDNYGTIQGAINAAISGADEIEVAPGTYNEAINFFGKAVKLYSSGGAEVTTINGNGFFHVVLCVSGEGANTILEGFTITGGIATGEGPDGQGGGMLNSGSSPTVTNCIFSGNMANEYGGGMKNFSCSPILTNCTFSGNSALSGGGVFNDDHSDTVLINCTFSGNSASHHGGGLYNYDVCKAKVTNCTFIGNTADDNGGGMMNFYYSSATITNCTFSGNSAFSGGGVFNDDHSDTVLINCTFSGNSASHHGGGLYNYDGCKAKVTNCTFIGNTADDDGGGMMNYYYSSATITNCTFGSNQATSGGGIRNMDNSNPTITNCILWGDTPAEITGGSPIVTYSDVEGGYTGTGNIDADPLFVDAAGGDLRLSSSASPCVDAGNTSAIPLDTADLDGDGNRTEPIPFDLNGDPRVWNDFVDMGALEYGTLRVHNVTQNTSYIGIQKAINDANDGDEIEVSPGTYNETIDFKGKSVRLYSTDGPNDTIIDGTGNYHVVQCVSGEDANTILEGFTITGGVANGASWPDYHGAGMVNNGTSPTVTDCNFSGNQATEGGGGMLNNYSNPTITNCTFYCNDAGNGGGMYNDGSNPTIINCFFAGNRAYFEGGAILNEENSEPNMTNCSFSGNDAKSGGGMYNVDSKPIVTNCILWGDTPDEINDVNSTSTVTYSDIQGGRDGEGNIDQNPLLRNVAEGDLSLAPWSPCIDMGNNDVVAGISIDITGQPRLVDGDCNGIVTVDMGAGEFRHAYGGDFDSSCLVNIADFARLALAWLTCPQSENWDPVCDISTPADGHIDAGDVKVLTGNWLRSIDSPITCDANRLKDEFGLDAPCVAAVLNAAPCEYSPNEIAQVLYDVGYSAAGTYKALTQVCGMTDGFAIEQILYDTGYLPEEYLESTALSFVEKFAPVLYFDRAHKGLPMSAQVYFQAMMSPSPDDPEAGKITWTTPWDGPCTMPGVVLVCGRDECNCGMQNNDFSTLVNGQVPTYYKVISDIDSDVDTGDKGRLRIWYWWFYGFQGPCNTVCAVPLIYCGADGSHHGDWEHIIVTTDPDRTRADAVTYSFHGEWYTRLSGGFETEPQGRPVVYVGKLSHGNWHSDEMSCFWLGEAYHCCEYADCRTPDENTKWYNAYQNLVSLTGNSEPWMLADQIGSLYEYYGQEYIISNWRWGPHISYDPGPFSEYEHTYACSTHPTTVPFNWIIESCDGVGCGIDRCVVEDWFDNYYPNPAYYNQGWPWEGESMSSVAKSATLVKTATPVTYGSAASCGSCGDSRFGVLIRLSDYWLAAP